jgi:flagellar biosynthesis/type III secretory pathway chaperone
MTTNAVSDVLSEGFRRLEQLLDEQCAHYRRVEEIVDAQRESLRGADVESLVSLSTEERELLEKIRVIDHRRVELVSAIASEIGLATKSSPALSDLIEHSGSRRGRLVSIADELRQLIAKTRAASRVVRTAAEGLARHMQGIVQSVEQGLSRSGIYERTGRIVSGPPRHSAIDIRS